LAGRGENEGVVGNAGGAVLADLVVVDHLAQPKRDLVLAAQRPAFSPGRLGDLDEFRFR
jgi:hypothetical protein